MFRFSRPVVVVAAAATVGLLLALLPGTAARAQTPTPLLAPERVPFDFYARGPYRADLPRPAALLGYEPGEFHTNYANYERVLRELAAKSDRLRVLTLGQTAERRPLYLLAVSTPENLARLDAVKADLARLADPRGCSDAEAAAIAARSPMVVWLSYSIHGDESAAFEAGMQVLYQLLATDEPRLVSVLGNCVVLINPAQNPDGHERFVTWYNAVGLGRPEAFSYEHRQPWSIYGRFNHFGFDLNRDLLPASQAESRAAMAAFLDWHPQVNADHHGETKNFFFPPPALPVNQALPREDTMKWQDLFGQANAAAFNAFHWLYYSRDVFDLYYPGYWDSWPSLHGSIGMTFETDGGGKRGLNWKRDDNTIETLREAIAKHFTASLTTLETAAAHREERLRDYHRFFATALTEAATPRDGVRQVAIAPGRDPGRAAALVANLLRQGVEVRRAERPFTLPNARDYLGNPPVAQREFPAGTYLVDLAQPQGRVARTLLAPDSPLDPEFVRRQLDRQARNLRRGRREAEEKPEFYDVTAWSLPLVFGAEAAFTADPPAAGFSAPFVVQADPATGVTVSDRPVPGGSRSPVPLAPPPPPRAGTAYVWTPATEGAYRLAFKLLQEGYHLATALEPMRAGGRDFPRGTLLARVERNPESLHARVAALAGELGVGVVPVDTAFVDRGNVGPGSESVVSLRVPKVALIADDAVGRVSYGEIAYVLGQDFGVEFVPLTVASFRKTRMADFNVLVIPDGKADDLAEAFGKAGVAKLKGWCREGGTLICVGGAAGFAADKKVNLSGARVVAADLMADDDDDEKDAGATPGKSPAVPDRDRRPEGRKAEPPLPAGADASPTPDGETSKPAGLTPRKDGGAEPRPGNKGKPDRDDAGKDDDENGFDRRKIPLPVPGAILRATVNRDHFLTFGYEEDTLPVLVDTDQFLLPTKLGANVLTFAPAAPDGKPPAPLPLRLAGFVWPDNTERLLRGTAAVVEEPLGDGHVILSANGPSFRLLWRTTTRLWLNGVLYAPALGGGSRRD